MIKWTKVTLSTEELNTLRVSLDSLNRLIEDEREKRNIIFASHLSKMQNSVAKVLQYANTDHEVSELDVIVACSCLYGEEQNVPACKLLRNRLEQEVFGEAIVIKGDEDNDD